ncbi:MAG: 6-phosphogluconolactonase [bacterium]|nr:6-phosphogluconolactonase [bacterium]
MISIQIYPDVAAVAKAAARFVYEQISASRERRRFLIALSGGSTPKPVYQFLSAKPEAGPMMRSKVDFLFSDERAVPPESEQSNFNTAREGLFNPLHIGNTNVYRMRGEEKDLATEARNYEELIRRKAGVGANEIPRLDMILLGMGPDGHTASLFPGHDFDASAGRLVDAPYVESLKAYRLTFTLSLLNAAKSVLFVVAGPDKAEAVKKVLSAEVEGDILPARRVEAERTIWMIDSASASLLDPAHARGSVRLC